MSKFDELVREKIAIIDRSPERFQTEVEKAQLQIWKEIEKQFDRLDTKNGVVVQSAKNLSIISVIVESLAVAASTGEYLESVKSFLSDFDQAAKITTELAKIIDKGFSPSAFSKEVQLLYRSTAINQLFNNPISNTQTTLRADLISSIAAGSSFSEVLKSARAVVIGGPDTDGRMLANIKTVAATSIAVADAGYSAAVNEQSGFEWFRYTGGEIDTTRPFCEARNGKYFHKKEVEAWGSGRNAGDVGGIKKDGSWDGQIEGTTSSTIFTFRGGWNCRHQIIAVSISTVPKSVIDRNIANGNYKPKK
jgi:hypothetical protein